MDLIKLLAIFVFIVVVMKFKKPLYISVFAGIAGACVLYNISILKTLKITGMSIISSPTTTLVLAFYSITFLQRMLEKREHLKLAEKSLSGIFNNRRIIAMIAPFIIGLLPSPGAVVIASPIVDNLGENYVNKEEKTFITSYYRHISEAFLPTYALIILALQLSGIGMNTFVLSMLPMVAILFLLGYIFYIRKIPKETGLPASTNIKEDVKNMIRSLWTIALTIIIILGFGYPVYYAVIPVIILSIIINKFTLKELVPIFVSAFETKLIFNFVVIMVFKDILTYTGVINRLPAAFAALPIPPVVIFSLIFLIGTLVTGTQAIIAIGIPLAFAAIPNGGNALIVLLMCITYIAMQVSPTHVCLALVTDTFKTSFLDLVKSTIPVMTIFLFISSGYSYILYLFQ